MGMKSIINLLDACIPPVEGTPETFNVLIFIVFVHYLPYRTRGVRLVRGDEDPFIVFYSRSTIIRLL